MIRSQPGQLHQEIPINVYDNGRELVAVMPLPGLLPDSFEVRVTDRELIIEGNLRGPRQEEREYLLHEWHYGPFSRRVALPFAVDAILANATHGNGVLTVALPRSSQPRPGVIRLEKEGGSHHDQRQGHVGCELRPC